MMRKRGISMTAKQRIIIVGAGISGLAAAFYIKRHKPNVHVTVLEAADRIGGKIKTIYKDGFTIECGPEGYMARRKGLTDLIKAIGLGDQLVHSKLGGYSIYVNRRLRKMPKGAVMGVPTKLLPMVTTGLVSPWGKLRAAMDLLIPHVYQDRDLSVRTFFERRLGKELVANMIEPLLSGIYNGDLSDMSLEETLPQFVSIEKKHRSLILGMKTLRPPKPKKAVTNKTGAFVSLSGGLSTLTEKLADYADEVRRNTTVSQINAGCVTLEDGSVLNADAILLAASPKQFGPLLHFPEAWALSNDKRSSTATVAFAFKKEEVEALGITGYVVSRKEQLHITACSFMDRKWPHLAPDGYAFVRTYVGTPEDQAIVQQSDAAIAQAALADLRMISRIGTPLFSIVTRQIDNMPQYTVNHQQRVHAFENALSKIDGVFACGAMLHGVGLPDCTENARQTAEQVVHYLNTLEHAHS